MDICHHFDVAPIGFLTNWVRERPESDRRQIPSRRKKAIYWASKPEIACLFRSSVFLPERLHPLAITAILLMGVARLELARPNGQQILSLSRLPFRHTPRCARFPKLGYCKCSTNKDNNTKFQLTQALAEEDRFFAAPY
jgi:hypothetical protein